MAESLASFMSSQPVGATMQRDKRDKLKEFMTRHRDLQQNQNKAQGALLSVLFMTQITELKMLLDIGRGGHRFYELVLALLISSIALQIVLGMIIIYMGHLRFQRSGWAQRLLECFQCKCRLLCCSKDRRPNRRSTSYMSVRGPITRQEDPLPMPELPVTDGSDHDDDEIVGCCDWPVKNKMSGDIPEEDLAANHVEVANVKLGNAMARIVRATNEVERLEEQTKKNPRDRHLDEEHKKAKEDLADARKDKEEAEIEGRVAESRRQHAIINAEHREDREERKVFRKLSYWQQLALYLLYFIGLMNVFITAFGISGGART